MQEENLESKQTARFIVNACKQDHNIIPQIVRPLLDIDISGDFISNKVILADLNLLQPNLGISDIIALNWLDITSL